MYEPHLLVFAKHDDSPKEYIFAVPVWMEVRKGDTLLVDTKRGQAIATATSEMFEGRKIDDVALKYGAYLPIKKVRQVAGEKLRQCIRKKVENEVLERIKSSIEFVDELPF